MNFILKFSTLILTEELQLHFFTVTETLNQRHRIDRKKRLFYVHFNNVVLNFTEFKNIVKFMNFTEF